MNERVFVDTNVLVYLRDSTDPAKQRKAAEWVGRLWETSAGRISAQILREYYVTVTEKLDPGMPREEARADVAALGAWQPLFPGPDLFDDAWVAQDRYGFSFWDALVVAAARRLGCSILLTDDLQDGQDLEGLLVRSPFASEPP